MHLRELAKWIGAQVVGDGSLEVSAANTLEDAVAGQVSFLANPKYAARLETTRASAVIVGLSIPPSPGLTILKSEDPYYAFTQAVVILHGHRKHPHQGIHPAAHIDPAAAVGTGTIIYPGCYVGPRARIGRDCILYPNVVVYDDCILGDRVIVHAGAVIGQDGFGYATHGGTHHKIPQVGNVIVEDDVEIGANCAIERATLGSTVIGKGNKLCDLIAIGHGARIGPHGLLVAQVGVAGSTTLGHHATIGGQAGIAGHLKIGDNVTIAAQAGVMDDIPDETTLIGSPAMPAGQARRVYSIFMQLPEIVERIKKLEQGMGELDAGDEGPENV
jgi:UDP-3-O-[3-hydroxymyristoyl] glucosamine N-acyltransferase